MKAQPTPANLKRKSELVIEYATKGNWSAIVRLIGGNPQTDLDDYVYGEEADAERGAPNFV